MICCRELVEHLFDYDCGTLPTEVRIEFEQHLQGCTSCMCYLESYQVTIRLSRQLPREPLPQRLEARLQQILARQTPTDGDAGGGSGSR